MNNEVAVIIKLCLLKLKVLFLRNLSYSLAKKKLVCKSLEYFLYDRDHRHERVKVSKRLIKSPCFIAIRIIILFLVRKPLKFQEPR